ncbi:hypothetical protein [Neomoorella thermoacetica]|uniref:hypothetical protein n=1 Tax=Neomoorella thermoacetica TaxID=1525 RepID=UPI0030D352ED
MDFSTATNCSKSHVDRAAADKRGFHLEVAVQKRGNDQDRSPGTAVAKLRHRVRPGGVFTDHWLTLPHCFL